MKKRLTVVALLLVLVMLLATGCTTNVNAKSSRRTLTIYEQWTEVNAKFDKVVAALEDGSEARVELRINELDDDGYPKKYEFVGYKDNRVFLVYDEDGELKN